MNDAPDCAQRVASPDAHISHDAVVAINFIADAGKEMLESSTSVSEVIDRLREMLPSVGLEGCSLDATMSSLILSYWEPGQSLPLTTMRDLKVASPRFETLTATDALLDSVEQGEIDVSEAGMRLRALVHQPKSRSQMARIAVLVSVCGWVLFLNGTDLLTIAVALLATALVVPVHSLVRGAGLPDLLTTVLAALMIAAIPNLLAAAGLSISVGPAVAGALFVYLPGRAFVSSVIDGLANAPLSSIARGLQALVIAGALAAGMLLGSRLGAGLGVSSAPSLDAAPRLVAVVGAALGVGGLAQAWGMPRRQLVPTMVIGAAGWLVASLASGAGQSASWVLYGTAAVFVGVSSALAAHFLGAAASIYSGVAILPLVPGFTLYVGMLALAQGDNAAAAQSLGEAGIVSVSIAVGVAVGLALARNSIAVSRRLNPAKLVNKR